jgi:cation diffusion facilitator family transporter
MPYFRRLAQELRERDRESGSASVEKRRAAASSVLAACGLTIGKGIIGLATGSLGILAEAAHSALDMAAAVVTYLAVRVSDRPADSEHTYGHGKIENLASLIETLLLLVTCAWIIFEAINRLFFKSVEVESSIWAFVVMIGSIVVDVSRSRMLLRVARKHQSQALEADALHFSTDVWSSTVVLAGLVFVRLADAWKIPWLAQADAIAALGVSAIVIHVSVELGRRSVAALIDGVPASLHDELMRAVRVQGVLDVKQARLRHSGARPFADVVLAVKRHTTLDEGHAIASAAEEAVQRVLPGADVIVHVEPGGGDHQAGLLETVHLLAARYDLTTHNLQVIHEQGKRSLELHIELAESLDVSEAHNRVSAFEAEIKRTMPEIGDIVSHIEPVSDAGASTVAADRLQEEEIVAIIRDLVSAQNVRCLAHDVTLRAAPDGLRLSFHCTIDGQTSLAQAHALTDEIERGLRRRMPHLARVMIHIEPSEESDGASRSPS